MIKGYCAGLLTVVSFGSAVGTGRCFARSHVTSWATCSLLRESLKAGIFWPPFSIRSAICAGFQVFRMLSRDGPLAVPAPVAPWQYAQPLSWKRYAPACSAALVFDPKSAWEKLAAITHKMQRRKRRLLKTFTSLVSHLCAARMPVRKRHCNPFSLLGSETGISVPLDADLI